MALTTVESTPRIGTGTDIETLVSGKHAAGLRGLMHRMTNEAEEQLG